MPGLFPLCLSRRESWLWTRTSPQKQHLSLSFWALSHCLSSGRLSKAPYLRLRKITGLLKYKNCKYFIYLSFFLLRLPFSLVTEFCLLGFRGRARRPKGTAPNPIDHCSVSTHMHTQAHEHAHTCTQTHTTRHVQRHSSSWPFPDFPLGFQWFSDLPYKICMLKIAVSINASKTVHSTEAEMWAKQMSCLKPGQVSAEWGNLYKIVAAMNFQCIHSFFPITTYKAWKQPWRWIEKWSLPVKGSQSQQIWAYEDLTRMRITKALNQI